jgi:hypothetical protein
MNWVSDPSPPPVIYFPTLSLSTSCAVGILWGGAMAGGDAGLETAAARTP